MPFPDEPSLHLRLVHGALRSALVGLLALVGGLASAQTLPTVRTIAVPYKDIQNLPGLTGLTAASCSGADDCLTAAIALPFTFDFLGQSRTSVRLSSNGWISFDAATPSMPSAPSNLPFPDGSTPNDLIAFAWDDLRSVSMSYGVFGAVGRRVFVIENVYRGAGASGGDAKNQIWLYEADGSFELRYDGGANLTSALSASIGFENADGSAGFGLGCSPTCTQTDIAGLDGRMLRAGTFTRPQLAVDGLSFPRGALPGASGTATVTVANLATVTATAVLVDVWLSTDEVLDPSSDVRITTATIASVPADTTEASVTFTVPAGTAAGDFRLLARVDGNQRYRELLETDNLLASEGGFATAYELSASDCRVTNPDGVNPGDTVELELDVVNSGVALAGNLTIEVRASRDSVLDGTDPSLRTVTVPVSGASLETTRATFTLGALAPGRYFPACLVDATGARTEVDETNNVVVGATAFDTGPDFLVGAVTMPGQVRPGDTVSVRTTIINEGVPFTAGVQYRLFASVDDVLDAGTDVLLGQFEATLGGAATVDDVRSVRFSTSLPPARYRLIVELDHRALIPETDETNNVGVSATDIVNAVDFVAAGASVDVSRVQAGDTLRVSASAASIGLGYVGNIPIRVYFSADAEFDATDAEVYRGLFFMNGPTPRPFDVQFAMPSVDPGAYNVLVVVNPDFSPIEADRANNSARASTLVTVDGADLRPENLVAPSIAFIGRDMEVTLTIRNESSESDARGFRYAYYLSEDELIRVTDERVFVSNTATITADGSQTFVDQVAIPATYTSTRARYLGVIVDIFSAVPETNERNNGRRTPLPIRIVFPIPDLVGQIVQTATAAAAGEQLAITRLLTNAGVEDAPSFDYAYYLSDNPTITPDDRLLGTFSGGLSTNSDDFGIDVVDIPADVISGSYYVGLILDPDEVVVEVDETNNAALGPVIPVFGAAIVFVTTAVSDATVGVRYETGLYARGGPLPIVWSIPTGQLPPGITLDANEGILAGEPTTEGRFDFTLRASSGTAFAERDFSIRVSSPTIGLQIATTVVRSALAGRGYDAGLVAVGGIPPYRWSVISSLPTGLEITEGGRLLGTPATPGQFLLTVRVEDELGARATAQIPLNVVSPGQSVQIDQVAISPPIVGVPYCGDNSRVRLSARNGVPPYAWSSLDELPPGLGLSEEGELCGTPERAGDYDVRIRVQDSTGLFDTALFRVTVRGNDACAISTFTLPPGQIGQPYLEEDGDPIRLTQTRCVEPLMDWGVVADGGGLPPGLTLGADGVLSGTPTEAGNYAFIAIVADATFSSALQPLSIIVPEEPPVIGPIGEGCTCAQRPEPTRPLAGFGLLVGLAMVLGRRRRRHRRHRR